MRAIPRTYRRLRWTWASPMSCGGWTALASMARQYPLRALIVRTEFTVSASQAVKARMVGEQYGGSLTVRQYRYEISKGIDWARGRAAA